MTILGPFTRNRSREEEVLHSQEIGDPRAIVEVCKDTQHHCAGEKAKTSHSLFGPFPVVKAGYTLVTCCCRSCSNTAKVDLLHENFKKVGKIDKH